MTKRMAAALVTLAALPAFAQDVASTDPPAADPVVASADAVDSADPEAKTFVPPPGFKTKKQGNLTLYCKKDSTVGTRFKTEKCYSEDQVRDYLLALEIQKRDIDRIRSTCATGAVCAPQ